MKILNIIFIIIIKFYQKILSPLLGNNCRFYPTCSNYAIESFSKHNFIKAFLLSIFRILRCNPYSKGGYDPVPLKKEGRETYE
ncbi:MAG TPA: membrane protein insertion efficiency factor YidD [Spirochaetota bacterium]|nr:membrane protein insertion efficiency factor YidD [Spirochaetota bacterium]HOM38822.1 membrane protein insertion efficiency factor YidD [Spirochaetota bacterium]HPQ49880.1 membrane protein insertion efficiency factor YidD [Spirochaetota bacterium]